MVVGSPDLKVLEMLQVHHDAPLLEWLGLLDRLEAPAEVDLGLLINALEISTPTDQPTRLAAALLRTVPTCQWAELLVKVDEANLDLAPICSFAMGPRLAAALLDALDSLDLEDPSNDKTIEFGINRLIDLWQESRKTRVDIRSRGAIFHSLIVHKNEDIAMGARILSVHTQMLEQSSLEEELLRICRDENAEIYAEELLNAIADAGSAYQDMGRSLAPFFANPSAHLCCAAARAAVSTQSPGLVNSIEAALQRITGDDISYDDLDRTRAGTALSYAIWHLDRREDQLDRAFAAAAENLVAMWVLMGIMKVTPVDERLASALSKLATSRDGAATAFAILEELGQIGADILRPIPSPAPGDKGWHAFRRARYKLGLDSAAEMVDALERPLDAMGWELFIAANLGTATWYETIDDALRREQDEQPSRLVEVIVSELISHPEIGRLFLPELTQGRFDAAVEAIWSELPTDVFWESISSPRPRAGSLN